MERAATFNRTIVELKRGRCPQQAGYVTPFNRTIVELKQGWHRWSEPKESTFNRTIVELKLKTKTSAHE